MYGNDTPTLRDLAVRLLSQTASATACERNWSTFALVHTKQRNRLAYKKLERLVFCSYNMKLHLRDKEAELDPSSLEDPLGLVEHSFERMGHDENDVLGDWIRPAHLDDELGNPNADVAQLAREEGIDVDRVLTDEVGIANPSQHHTTDVDTSTAPSGSHGGGNHGMPLSPRSVGTHYSHMGGDAYYPTVSTDPLDYGLGGQQYHAQGPSGGGSEDMRDMDRHFDQYSSMSLSTREEDDIARSFGSFRVNDYASSSGSYAPPELQYESYYVPPPAPVPQSAPPMSQPDPTIFVRPEFPIYGRFVGLSQEHYDGNVNNYIRGYSSHITWYQYCMMQDGVSSNNDEPARSSFWY